MKMGSSRMRVLLVAGEKCGARRVAPLRTLSQALRCLAQCSLSSRPGIGCRSFYNVAVTLPLPPPLLLLLVICRSSRKQQRPQRKSSAAAAAADGHGLLLLDEQDAAVDEAGAGHDATFASLLQHMSAAGVSMAAARSAAGGAGAADANAMPRGPVSAQRLAETRALVAEDVGRLAQEWMAANKSTLQAAAPDFWHR